MSLVKAAEIALEECREGSGVLATWMLCQLLLVMAARIEELERTIKELERVAEQHNHDQSQRRTNMTRNLGTSDVKYFVTSRVKHLGDDPFHYDSREIPSRICLP